VSDDTTSGGTRREWISLVVPLAMMMFALGLTLGAIAVFSATSVTNTLLELLVGVALAGAGLFAANKEIALPVPVLLRSVAVVAMCLIGGYWVGWIGGGIYRESHRVLGEETLQDARTELLAYEVKAYAKLLGIPHEVYTARITFTIRQDRAARTAVSEDTETMAPVSCALQSQYVVDTLQHAIGTLEQCAFEPAVVGRAGEAALRLTALHESLEGPDEQGAIAASRVLAVDALASLQALLRGAGDLEDLLLSCRKQGAQTDVDRWQAYLLHTHFDQCNNALLVLRDEYITAVAKYRSFAPTTATADALYMQLERLEEP